MELNIRTVPRTTARFFSDSGSAWRKLWRESVYVCVHDVAPVFVSQIEKICAELRPLLGSQMSAAVVPRWKNTELGHQDDDFAQLVRRNFDDVLLHGLTHQNVHHRGLVAGLTGDADELRRLDGAEIERRLADGQAILERTLGFPAVGFAPPAWHWGNLTVETLARHRLEFCLGLQFLWMPTARFPVATWSWDLGVVPGTGMLGGAFGHVSHILRPSALPVVVLHPRDVQRGYLPRAMRVIRSLLAAGRRPICFAGLSESECRAG